jgi:type IV fimbrial biogenesis protein FimT
MLDNQSGWTVLITKDNLKGMSLVEILIAVAIVAILFAAAAPDFSSWMQNTKIRNAAEAMQNGLNLAKSEAVHRNAVAQFVSCGGSSWDVIASSSVANTNVCASGTATTGWSRVQARPAQNGSDNAVVNTAQSTIGFNGMGRQTSTTDIASATATPAPPVAVDFNVSTSLAGAACFCPAGTCGYPSGITYSSTGKLRCLRVSVSSGGQVRMCDPALPASTPQGC